MPASYILFYLLLILLSYTFLYKLFFIYVFLQYKDTNSTSNPQKKSIFLLVSVKNESKQLFDFLTSLSNQDFSSFSSVKTILIDDHSNPDESTAMSNIVEQFSFASIYKSTNSPGKKNAIAYGYSLINDGNILLLDADCRPASSEWMKRMSSQLDKNSAVLGYAPFFKNKSFVNKLIRFECMWIAAQYMGYALRKTPYMGVGRNMAVTKKAVEKVQSCLRGRHLISGDDDLLIQSLSAQKMPISVVNDPTTFVYSTAEKTYGKYLKQKVRQITTSKYYSFIHKILLASDSASHILFTILLLVACFFLPSIIILILFLIKFFIAQVFHMAIAKKLQELDLVFMGGILEFLYSLHLIVLSLYSFVARKNVWK